MKQLHKVNYSQTIHVVIHVMNITLNYSIISNHQTHKKIDLYKINSLKKYSVVIYMSNNENNDLSYSVFIEQKKDTNESRSFNLPRRLYKWVDDDTVSNCHNCNSWFSLFNRKHHCRFCGQIFCSECVKYSTCIPNELLSEDAKKGTWNDYISYYVSTKDPTKHKVCKQCKDLVDFIDVVKKKIEIFIQLNLTIKDLKHYGKVCKEWYNASNYILSIFREIQYKLPHDEYTELEKKLLWTNINYLAGHNKYLVHLIKICRTQDDYIKIISILNEKRKINCWSLMCSRNCSNKLTSFDSIGILCHSFKHLGYNDILRNLALSNLQCDDQEFKCYLPLLVYYLRYDKELISEFLINRCVNNFVLLNSLYWELQLYPKDIYHEDAYSEILNKLKKLFSDTKYHSTFVKILEGYQFVQTLNNISKEICDNNKKYEEIKDVFKFKGTFTCPLDHTNIIKSIHLEKIKVKNSATKPIIIPCETTDNKIVNVLHKREDVRKDQIIMNLIHLIDIILKREENLDLGIITYNILPTDKNTGIIEIIDKSETIYAIQEKLKSSILNYVLSNNEDMKVRDIRNVFINSTAAYCVITYLFGVGDRHLDNIMLSDDGKLFHIDYGYILGNDPLITNPGIRITPEIIDAIGGLSSKNYQIFTELCSRIYNCLRRHINIFMHILSILPKISDINISETEIRTLLIKRFIPGESIVNSNLHLVSQLERQNYVDKIKDWCHYHSKEGTVSSAMNRLTYAVANLVVQTMPEEKPIQNSTIRY